MSERASRHKTRKGLWKRKKKRGKKTIKKKGVELSTLHSLPQLK